MIFNEKLINYRENKEDQLPKYAIFNYMNMATILIKGREKGRLEGSTEAGMASRMGGNMLSLALTTQHQTIIHMVNSGVRRGIKPAFFFFPDWPWTSVLTSILEKKTSLFLKKNQEKSLAGLIINWKM